ncbi:MAG TPA: hypothetical protein VK619_10405 [Pyrinomonadaceae bacterium]|nr:hypothetical protein [Pyrinomonadaceae bacterium]
MTNGHYSVQDNGTTMAFLTDETRHSEFVGTISFCETDEEFTAWASGDSLACKYDDEYYVKVKVNEDDYEAMTLSAANEYIASLEESDEN